MGSFSFSFFSTTSARARPTARAGQRSFTALLAFVLLCVLGCGSSDDARQTPDPDDGNPPPLQKATSLTFVPGQVLRLLPLEQTSLGLVAGPPGVYLVRFALLPDRPNTDPNDASLDRAQALTDDRGVVTVALTAPSTPSTFTVRAAIDDLEARVPISVSDKGYGAIVVQPVYAGARSIETWVASVRIGSSCGDLVGFPPPDGALAVTSNGDELPVIDGVPVGPIASVSVRSGQFVYGCTNVPDLGTDETRTVTIDVADRPLQLEGQLLLELYVEDESTEWLALLSDTVTERLAAFRGEAVSDVHMLLDDMELLSNDPESFADFRANHDYEALVEEILTSGTALVEQLEGWLRGGVSQLGPFVGELTIEQNAAHFRLLSAGGLPAESSGFLDTARWDAYADPGDTLIAGGELLFQAPRWVLALAAAEAREQFGEASDVAEALAYAAGCAQIGESLAAIAAPGEDEATDCDAACVQTLCEAALTAAWARATATNGELTRIAIGLSGTAQVDSSARPIAFEGSWLGTLEGPASAVGGKAEGSFVR